MRLDEIMLSLRHEIFGACPDGESVCMSLVVRVILPIWVISLVTCFWGVLSGARLWVVVYVVYRVGTHSRGHPIGELCRT